MDRQAWIAVTLCIIGLVAWQVYMAKHPAPVPAKISVLRRARRQGWGETLSSREPRLLLRSAPARRSLALPARLPRLTRRPRLRAPFVEKTTTLRNADLEVLLTNRGGGIAGGDSAKAQRGERRAGEVEFTAAPADRRHHREACGAGARGILDRAEAGQLCSSSARCRTM